MLLGLGILATGCTSTRGYFADRGRDAADIFTATVGVGLGAKVRAGPIHAGLFTNAEGVGLRGGRLFSEWFSYAPYACEVDLTLYCFDCLGAYHDPGRYKSYTAGSENPLIFSPFYAPLNDSHSESIKTAPGLHPYYTQIEVAAGCIASIRLGFNPGELLDFMLGWTSFDIFNDDLEWKEK